jgi:hypothetical protein
MPHRDARERFKLAVGILADEKGRIKDRLLTAYVSQLATLDPHADLPPRMVPQFDRLKIRLNESEVVGDRGNASLKIKALSEDEASDVAKQIFSMFLDISGLESK